jgi:hypothetical protein
MFNNILIETYYSYDDICTVAKIGHEVLVITVILNLKSLQCLALLFSYIIAVWTL